MEESPLINTSKLSFIRSCGINLLHLHHSSRITYYFIVFPSRQNSIVFQTSLLWRARTKTKRGRTEQTSLPHRCPQVKREQWERPPVSLNISSCADKQTKKTLDDCKISGGSWFTPDDAADKQNEMVGTGCLNREGQRLNQYVLSSINNMGSSKRKHWECSPGK